MRRRYVVVDVEITDRRNGVPDDIRVLAHRTGLDLSDHVPDTTSNRRRLSAAHPGDRIDLDVFGGSHHKRLRWDKARHEWTIRREPVRMRVHSVSGVLIVAQRERHLTVWEIE